jgi:hypothetical protein
MASKIDVVVVKIGFRDQATLAALTPGSVWRVVESERDVREQVTLFRLERVGQS